jgi:TPR repeat protein
LRKQGRISDLSLKLSSKINSNSTDPHILKTEVSMLRKSVLWVGIIALVLFVLGNVIHADDQLEKTKRLAEQGNADAQALLGAMYHDGRGVSVDYQEAMKWLLKSAEQGDADAQTLLGAMYHDGRGVSVDFKEAMKWFLKSAEQGDTDAQFLLGRMNYHGRGVSVDYQEAMKWYLKSAEQGHDGAQFFLGAMYMQGKGVPVDKVEGYVWTSLAAAQGNTDAKKVIEFMDKGMTPEEITEAQGKAAELWEKIKKAKGDQ